MSKQGANALGVDDAAVVATIQALAPADFEKPMTSYADHRVWQDVYRPQAAGTELYIKFTLDARQASCQLQGGMRMAKTPRDYPETMTSPESGRPMVRGEKLVSLQVDGKNLAIVAFIVDADASARSITLCPGLRGLSVVQDRPLAALKPASTAALGRQKKQAFNTDLVD